MANPTPEQVSNQLRMMADKIDRSKNPDPAKVAADIKMVIAALSPEAPAEAPKPIKLSFKGKIDDQDLMTRAAAEVAKRRPGLKGRAIKFSLIAEPVDD
jgi:hypothetical protein